MAVVNFYKPVDMRGASVWEGDVTNASSTNITFDDHAGSSASFDGNFSYSGSALSGGTISGFREYSSSSLHYSVTGISLDALTLAGYLATGDALGLMRYAAGGSDTFSGSSGNDRIDAFTGNDLVAGNEGNDSLYGGDGSDELRGGSGSDLLDGGAGLDTAVYAGTRASYTVSSSGSGFVVTDSNGARDGADTLAGVERLKFADATVALDISGTGGQAYRIYQAAFNRTPDAGGLGYWIKVMDGGASLRDVAAGFVTSAEFKSVYGANPTNAELVFRYYENVLHRAPEAGGYNYWLGVLNQGQDTAAGVLANISESAENQAGVIGAIGNGFVFTPFG